MKKMILGFVGEMSSGKGTACDYLVKKHQAQSFRFSTILRDILNRLHLAQERDNLIGLSTALRQTFGQNLLAKVIAHDAEDCQSQVVCIDGIRRLEDIEYLRKITGFKLIYLTAKMEVRYERLTKRRENTDDQSKTFEQFQNDHHKETELTIPAVAAVADYKIENNGGQGELQGKIDEIIRALRNS